MKMVTISKNGIYIENDHGKSVFFRDAPELLAYTEIDLTLKIGVTETIGYEPTRKIHTRFNGFETTTAPIPDPDYELLIAKVDVYAERKADPYFGMEASAKLAAQRGDMWTAIKNERELRTNGGFKVEVSPSVYKWFHSDQPSRLQQIGLVMAGSALPAIQWKTMDNSFITMTPTIANMIFQAGFALDTALFMVAEQHRAAMLQSTNPLSYDYSTGWPEHYAI